MSDHNRGILIAVLAVLVLSPDSLFVRLVGTDPWTLLFWRGIGMVVMLLGVLAVGHGRRLPALVVGIGWTGVAASLCFMGSTVFFVNALDRTSVANTLAIVAVAPLLGAMLSRLLLDEPVRPRTWITALLALGCVVFIVSGSLGRGNLTGDLHAFGTAACIAATFVLMRRAKEVNMVPAMALSGVFTTILAVVMAPPAGLSAAQVPPLLMLCFVVVPLAFGLMSMAPRYIPAPELNMILLLEMVLGPLFVWLVVGERPPAETLIGGGMLFAVLIANSVLGLRDVAQTAA